MDKFSEKNGFCSGAIIYYDTGNVPESSYGVGLLIRADAATGRIDLSCGTIILYPGMRIRILTGPASIWNCIPYEATHIRRTSHAVSWLTLTGDVLLPEYAESIKDLEPRPWWAK